MQDIRYAANGDFFVSVGSDAKVFLYDGKTGETVGEFEEGHKGSIVSNRYSELGDFHTMNGGSLRWHAAGAQMIRPYQRYLQTARLSCVRNNFLFKLFKGVF